MQPTSAQTAISETDMGMRRFLSSRSASTSWRDEERNAVVHSAEEPGAGTATRGSSSDELSERLQSLDGGRGRMLEYLEPLREHFGNLWVLESSIHPRRQGLASVG